MAGLQLLIVTSRTDHALFASLAKQLCWVESSCIGV